MINLQFEFSELIIVRFGVNTVSHLYKASSSLCRVMMNFGTVRGVIHSPVEY